ncbi:MAG: WXG100 family type VII secretion target [Oscillospiraceae bacterium]|nr:WXG100 family type VII secretion target [Oscillospiraceae bacterium]
MAETIKITTEQMRETVEEYKVAKESLKEAYEWMDRSLRMLDTCWRGAAYMAMKAQWDVTYKNIRMADLKMQDAIEELNATANLFDAREADTSAKFSQLDTGVSPYQ